MLHQMLAQFDTPGSTMNILSSSNVGEVQQLKVPG